MAGRDLHVTSPLLAGPDVLTVQRRLAELGFDPGPIDGRYGPETEGAVRAFQSSAGLDVDGIVGPGTRRALADSGPCSPGPDPDGTAVGLRALAEARTLVGTTEAPPGSNRTPFGAWFGADGVPWCGIFVSYCFSLGAGYTIAAGFAGAGCTSKGCSYVPTTEAWLKAAGMWRGRGDPRPGDIAIYNWDGGVPDHVGIVESNDGAGRFTAIEGNTSDKADTNGGTVMRRSRSVGQVDGFGRVAVAVRPGSHFPNAGATIS